MNKARILNCRLSDEIDREIRKNPDYIKADREFNKIVKMELSKEKAQDLKDLLGILLVVVGRAYQYEGIKLGTVIITDLLYG